MNCLSFGIILFMLTVVYHLLQIFSRPGLRFSRRSLHLLCFFLPEQAIVGNLRLNLTMRNVQ